MDREVRNGHPVEGFTRRQFLKTSASAAAGAGMVLGAPSLIGQGNDRKLKVGIVGCGGRGTGAARNSLDAYGTEISAIADLFPEKTDRARGIFKVDEKRAFTGFDAYKKLLETDVDYVILATPPGFRPEHFAACVEAGKHVFMEKPVAVDAPGIRTVLEAGKKAKEKNLSVVAGTQRRHQKSYLETIARIRDGAIGDIVAGRCYWCGRTPWVVERKEGWSDMEYMARNWYFFTWLCGDHIVEQHIHNLDVINWFLGAHPVRARGLGGRQTRTDQKYGQIFDHHAVDFEYPKDVHIFSFCHQMDGVWQDVSEHVVGTKGRSSCNGQIFGDNPWKFSGGGRDPYVQEHADLIDSIRNNKGVNEAAQVAESTLTAIMGREATYTGKVIVWDELLKSDKKLGPDKREFGPAELPPVPHPGAEG